MKLIDLTCTKCGAQLQVNPELKKCMCQYCGNEMLIDDETIHHKIDNGFQFGYEAELGRQKFKECISEIDNKIIQIQNSIKDCKQVRGFAITSIFIAVVILIICNWIALVTKY